MGWQINPYTGKPEFVPEGGMATLGQRLGQMIRGGDPAQTRRDQLNKILEQYAQAARGTPWQGPQPGAADPLDAFFEAQRQLGQQSQPGTPEYRDLTEQLAGIRTREALQQRGISPETYEAELKILGERRLGDVAEQEYGPGGFRERSVAAAEERARKTGMGRSRGPKKITENVLDAQGMPAQQDVFYDAEGNETRRGPIVPKQLGTAVEFDEQGRPTYMGPARKAGEGTRGRLEEKRKQDFQDQRGAVLDFQRQTTAVRRALSQGLAGGAVIGEVGNMMGRVASLGQQLGQIGTVLGTNSVQNFMDKAMQIPGITETLTTSGDLRSQELSLAYARVLAQSRQGSKDVGEREIRQAIAANAAIFNGTPEQRSAALQALERDVVGAYNTRVRNAGMADLAVPYPIQMRVPNLPTLPTAPSDAGATEAAPGIRSWQFEVGPDGTLNPRRVE